MFMQSSFRVDFVNLYWFHFQKHNCILVSWLMRLVLEMWLSNSIEGWNLEAKLARWSKVFGSTTCKWGFMQRMGEGWVLMVLWGCCHQETCTMDLLYRWNDGYYTKILLTYESFYLSCLTKFCNIIAGREAHVMTFEVGAVLEDEKWQAPVYCFHNEKKKYTE